MNKDSWRFINTFAPWLSAIGTLAAVITSLYLARRGDRISLKIVVGIRTIVYGGQPLKEGTESLSISITNTGRRAATIVNICWRFAPFRKEYLIQIPPDNPLSAKIPVIIQDGQTINFVTPIDIFIQNVTTHAIRDLSGRKNFWKRWFVKFHVITSTGHTFSTRLEKSLWELLHKLPKPEEKL